MFEESNKYNKMAHNGIEQLTKLKQQLADLQAELEQVGKRWRAKYGEGYFYVTSALQITWVAECNEEFDNVHYQTGNCFKTQAEAEEYKKALLMIQEYEIKEIKSTYNCLGEAIVVINLSEYNNKNADEIVKALRLILKGAN